MEGVNEGNLPASARISRLSIRIGKTEMYNYDRGLDFCFLKPVLPNLIIQAVLSVAK